MIRRGAVGLPAYPRCFGRLICQMLRDRAVADREDVFLLAF